MQLKRTQEIFLRDGRRITVVDGGIIKRFRESRKMIQLQLAEELNVSDKTTSKWETGRGYLDIALFGTAGQGFEIICLRVSGW